MNEPQGVDLGSLKKYYQAGYDAVRKYTSSAYVIMSNPLDRDSKVLLPFVRAFDRVVIDVHYYNLFSDQFSNMNVKQNIDYIKYHRASDLRSLTTSNGPLIFVGKLYFHACIIRQLSLRIFFCKEKLCELNSKDSYDMIKESFKAHRALIKLPNLIVY